jgi:hypothetical protein
MELPIIIETEVTYIMDTDIKQNGIEWVQTMLRTDMTYTKPGSLSFLLHGKRPSEQSISIKMARFGEFLTKEMIKRNGNLGLLTCGIQQINNKKKDVDRITQQHLQRPVQYMYYNFHENIFQIILFHCPYLHTILPTVLNVLVEFQKILLVHYFF